MFDFRILVSMLGLVSRLCEPPSGNATITNLCAKQCLKLSSKAAILSAASPTPSLSQSLDLPYFSRPPILFSTSPHIRSVYGASDCIALTHHVVVQMCIDFFIGSTKYLGCGHISGVYQEKYPCNKHTCTRSPEHSPNCRRGMERGCFACSAANRACHNHHRCRPESKIQQRYDRTRQGRCSECY